MAFKLSLTQAWTLLILAATLVPTLMLVTLYSRWTFQHELDHTLTLERVANARLRDRLEAEVARLTTLIVNKSDPIATLIGRHDETAVTKIERLVRLIFQRETAIHTLAVVRADGEIVHLSQAVPPPHPPPWPHTPDYPALVIPSLGRIHLGAAHPYQGRWVFTIAVPLGDPSRGALIALVDIDRLWQNGHAHRHPEHGTYSYLVDSRGSLLTPVPWAPYPRGALLTRLGIVRAGLIHEEWHQRRVYTGLKGIAVFGTSTVVPSLNWTLISETPEERLTGPIHRLLARIVLVTLAGVALFVWAVLYLSRRTIRPLRHTCQALRAVAQGDYNQRVEANGIRELNDLAEGFNQMLTARRRAEEKILYQAHFDSLTGLPNRFLILDRLQQLLLHARQHGEKVAVLFLDLDDFKKINDGLGHDTGDQVLIEAGRRLREVSGTEACISRLGGDEFIVLLDDMNDPARAAHLAERIIQRFREPFQIGQRSLVITVSIGIAIFPDDGDDTSILLRHADMAMYRAKSEGRNTFACFTTDMNREINRRLALEERMHAALEQEAFEIHYQPQFDLESGHLIGTEALLRWHDAELGPVSPGEFIPLAEQNGMIVPLGDYVLHRALAQLRQWRADFAPALRIAVNFSPRQFNEPDLVQRVERALVDTGIPSDHLEMEITEGVLMHDQASVHRAMQALRNLGVVLSMDDFGTGYSSLSYLRHYPFDVLKIDRSFINDITTDPGDRELIHAAIVMAHGMNMKVVAEGIETEEQLALLRQLGCDYGQGWLLGKPLPAAAFTARFLRRREEPVS